MDEINETLVCVLKLIFRTNTVRGIIDNALIIRIKPIIRIIFINIGSFKKMLIAGDAKNKEIYKKQLY